MKAIIHHWDTDGICSAAIISEEIGEKPIDNFSPEIGKYDLNNKEVKRLDKYEEIYIVDLNFSKNVIQKIRENTSAHIFFYDHHNSENISYEKFEFNNPIASGKDPKLYPSNTWVLSEKFNRPTDLLKILGAVGDREKKIKENKKANKEIKDFIADKDINFNKLTKAVNLIDSSYKMNSKKEVHDLVQIVRKANKNGIQTILTNNKLKQNLEKINKKITELSKINDKEPNEIVVKEINTEYNIISSVTREIAWNQNKTAIVINKGFLENKNQIYVRSNKTDLRPLISELKEEYKLGGKKDVIGSVIEKKKTDKFISDVRKYLKQSEIQN